MDELGTMASALGLSLSEGQLAQFARYEALLLEWNQRLNLTGIREPQQIRVRHFLDSLSVAGVTGDMAGASLVDVGAGAGFPGLPLKILYPAMTLTLIESAAKKAHFLEAVCSALMLENVQVVAERVELVAHQTDYREQFDWAVARGVAELRVLVEYLLPLLQLGGTMLAQKGEGAQQELTEAAPAISLLGGSAPRLHTVQLPGVEKLHYLVLISKERPTPPAYPRRPGMPSKRPL
jgi:16S rRNA (guanine527-N7)-methyltransferase